MMGLTRVESSLGMHVADADEGCGRARACGCLDSQERGDKTQKPNTVLRWDGVPNTGMYDVVEMLVPFETNIDQHVLAKLEGEPPYHRDLCIYVCVVFLSPQHPVMD